MQKHYEDTLYVDAVKTIEYKQHGFGFIQGFKRLTKIFFHINDLKKAGFSNFDKLKDQLEYGGSESFPLIWFVAGKYGEGLCIKEFLTDQKFKELYQESFLSDYGNSLKDEISEGRIIDCRTDLLLLKLFDNDGYAKIISDRYDRNNQKITQWSLGFIPSRNGNKKQDLSIYTLPKFRNEKEPVLCLRGKRKQVSVSSNEETKPVLSSIDEGRKPLTLSLGARKPMTLSFNTGDNTGRIYHGSGLTEVHKKKRVSRHDNPTANTCLLTNNRLSLLESGSSDSLRNKYLIPDHLHKKLPDLNTCGEYVPVFFKRGINVLGDAVATDICLYDSDSIPENSDVINSKEFLDEKLTDPTLSEPCDFWVACSEILLNEEEKAVLQNKKEHLKNKYLEEQKRIAREKEEQRLKEEAERRKLAEEAEKWRKEMQKFNELKEAEYVALREEMRPFGFTKSSQVTAYILSNNLKSKYGRIAGIVDFEKDGNNWKYDGGISPEYYKRLCHELGLSNNNSGSIVAGFSPYHR